MNWWENYPVAQKPSPKQETENWWENYDTAPARIEQEDVRAVAERVVREAREKQIPLTVVEENRRRVLWEATKAGLLDLESYEELAPNRGPDPAEIQPVIPKVYKGMWDEAITALKREAVSLASVLVGKATGRQNWVRDMEQYRLAPENQPGTGGGVKGAAANVAGSLVPQIAASMTPMGVGWMAGYMDKSAQEEAQELGLDPAQQDMTGAIVGTVNGLIEMAQIGTLLRAVGIVGKKAEQEVAQKITGNIIRRLWSGKGEIAKAGVVAAIEGGTQEALQEIVSVATPEVVNRRNPLPRLWLEKARIGGALVAGAVAEGVIGHAGRALNIALARPETSTIAQDAKTEAGAVMTQATGKVDPAQTQAVSQPVDPPAPETPKAIESANTAEEVRKVSTEIISDGITSARQKMVQEDRASLGLDGVPSADRKAWQTSLQNAKDKNIPDNALRIASEINSNPRALNDEETAGLVIKAARLKAEYKGLLAEMEKMTDPAEISMKAAEADRIEAEFESLTTALYKSGTEKGRALASQKLTINQDLDLITIKTRAKLKKGKELTAAETAKFEEMAQSLEAAQETIARLEQQMNEMIANNFVRKGNRKNGLRRYESMSTQQKDAELAVLVAETQQLLEEGCYN